MKKCIATAILFILFFNVLVAQPATVADQVTGYWFTADKDAKMQIYKCGERYCGKIYWLREPNESDGKPKVDKNNPNTTLRDRKLQGLEIMTEFEYDEDREWEDGEIYDPESGNTYSCQMELSEDGKTLDVRGYIGVSLFGRTETWTRTDK